MRGAGRPVSDTTGTAQDGLGLFPTRWTGLEGPQELEASNPGSRGLRAGSRGIHHFGARQELPSFPTPCPPLSCSRVLGPAGVLKLQVRGALPGTQALGAAGRAGAAEDPVRDELAVAG